MSRPLGHKRRGPASMDVRDPTHAVECSFMKLPLATGALGAQGSTSHLGRQGHDDWPRRETDTKDPEHVVRDGSRRPGRHKDPVGKPTSRDRGACVAGTSRSEGGKPPPHLAQSEEKRLVPDQKTRTSGPCSTGLTVPRRLPRSRGRFFGTRPLPTPPDRLRMHNELHRTICLYRYLVLCAWPEKRPFHRHFPCRRAWLGANTPRHRSGAQNRRIEKCPNYRP